jgi:hypothetical protein
LLATLCLADLLFSSFGLAMLGMQEGNPLFAMLWNISPLLFVVAKVASTVFGLTVFRYVWDRNRRLAEFGMSVAIVGYVLAGGLALLINSGLI